MSNILLKKTHHTAVITLNRAENMNALSTGFIGEIHETLDRIEADPDVYTVIITGTGRAFIAGADIDEMYGMNKEEIFQWSSAGSELNLRLEAMSRPVIAAINGYALGGGLELALACDIRLASEQAKMGLPEVGLGVICGAGGTQRLPAIVGEGIAKEMIFTGKVIDADEALRIGLVNRVTAPDELLDKALTMAYDINTKGQLAVRTAKEAINFSRNSDIREGCLREREIFSRLFETEDQKIGMGGFLQKKKNFTFVNR